MQIKCLQLYEEYQNKNLKKKTANDVINIHLFKLAPIEWIKVGVLFEIIIQKL